MLASLKLACSRSSPGRRCILRWSGRELAAQISAAGPESLVRFLRQERPQTQCITRPWGGKVTATITLRNLLAANVVPVTEVNLKLPKDTPKRSLVTGGAGFIGSHLVEALLAAGHRVTVVDDESTGRFANLERLELQPARQSQQLQLVRGSISDLTLVKSLLDDVDEVYHLAAAVGVALIAKEPRQTIERNIYPTQLLLDELCLRHQHGQSIKFFLASTSEVYGKNPKHVWNEDDDLVFGSTTKPRWSYGASKAIDEFLALACSRQFELPVVIARFFNVVGPRQSGAYGMVLPRFVEAAVAGRPLVVHDDGLQTRCFAHVADVVRGVIGLMTSPAAIGRVFNIGSDQTISILQLAQRVIAVANSSSEIDFQSYHDAYDSDFEDIRRRVPDLSRIRATIGWQAQLSLDDIIRDCLGAAIKS
jgi:UDP-glucose 4-epimerase